MNITKISQQVKQEEYTEDMTESAVPMVLSDRERLVWYVEQPTFYSPFEMSLESEVSDELSQISNPRLRCALRIADIMQALDFPMPRYGPIGGITAIARSRNVGPPFKSIADVYNRFPDDIMDQFKAYLIENH